MNVKVKLVNKHKSATADLWHYSGRRHFGDGIDINNAACRLPSAHVVPPNAPPFSMRRVSVIPEVAQSY